MRSCQLTIPANKYSIVMLLIHIATRVVLLSFPVRLHNAYPGSHPLTSPQQTTERENKLAIAGTEGGMKPH